MASVQPLQYYQRSFLVTYSLSSIESELSNIDAGYCIDAPESMPAGFFVTQNSGPWEEHDHYPTNAYDDALVPRPEPVRPPFTDRKFLIQETFNDEPHQWLVDFNTLYSANQSDEGFLEWLRSATSGQTFPTIGYTVTAI